MATILLLVILIAYIGLGIPDSLFGAAWPAIYADFGLPISYANFVNVIISCGTIISSIFSARIINRFGTAKVCILSTAMTAAGLLGYSFSGNLLFICLFAIPLGLGAGAIDTALNNYVSLRYSASQISFLHCFYGVGVSVSPYILSLLINGESGWRGGYRVAFFIQLGITLILLFTAPVWKKVKGGEASANEEKIKTLTLRETANIPGVKPTWLLFLSSCAIEWSCVNWGSTFLVEYKHTSAELAARIITFYFIGVALGRFSSGILGKRLNSRQIIRICKYVLCAALVLLLLPLSHYFSAFGLFLIGLGNGPLFPNFSSLTPQNFGKEASPFVMGTQMAASNIGVLAAPLLCGILGQTVGMGIFPYYLAAFYIVMLIADIRLNRALRAIGNKPR
ncbi:MAG: MFS transporter [Eubacterium sp.]|nr:MFS transporter [Eubacterium sp.]